MAIAYARLKKALGIWSGDLHVYDMIQQLAIVEPPVLDALGIDVVEMGRGFMQRASDWKAWVLPDGTPCKIPAFVNVVRRGMDGLLLADDGTELAIQKEGCKYFEQCHYPLIDRPIETDDFSDLAEQFAHAVWTGVLLRGAHSVGRGRAEGFG